MLIPVAWQPSSGSACRPQLSSKPGRNAILAARVQCSSSDRVQAALAVLQVLQADERCDPAVAQAVTVLPAAGCTTTPPAAWAALAAKLRAAAAADRTAVFRGSLLSSRHYPVPSYERGKARGRCQLTNMPSAQRFRDRRLNEWLAHLFECVPGAVAAAGLPPVRLGRHDLFHGHLFFSAATHQLGLLLHACEYPAYCPESFPVCLGYCQVGSTLAYDPAAMDRRNLLWYSGQLASLDVGLESALHTRLLMDGLQDVRTVLESDFGLHLADVNYFARRVERLPQHRVLICPR